MRVLFASTRGTGHFNPLRPFIDACLRQGHDVLIAGPPDLAEPVRGAGYEFWQFDPPPEDELGEVWSRAQAAPSHEERSQLVVGHIFGRLDTTAAVPRLREGVEEWRPDVVVREPNEYGSALAAELHGVRHARVGYGLYKRTEGIGLDLVAEMLDDVRRSIGLPADPTAERLRQAPYLTVWPESLDTPPPSELPQVWRFRDPAWDTPSAALPDWWAGSDAPLVYVTFGTVAASVPFGAFAYPAALEALGDLPVRALLTVGRDAEVDAFGAAPANVHVEKWVPQADVLGHAAVVVCHGGSGSTLGALAAGLPQVVVPLFADQPDNAERVAAVGAGISAAPEAGAIADALGRALEQGTYREAAGKVAAELRSQPPADAAVDVLEALAGQHPVA